MTTGARARYSGGGHEHDRHCQELYAESITVRGAQATPTRRGHADNKDVSAIFKRVPRLAHGTAHSRTRPHIPVRHIPHRGGIAPSRRVSGMRMATGRASLSYTFSCRYHVPTGSGTITTAV